MLLFSLMNQKPTFDLICGVFLALIFVMFDVEVLFVVPWAVVFKQLGMTAYVEMLIFIFILTLGLADAGKKGALEWQ